MEKLLTDHLKGLGFSIWVENIDPNHPDFATQRNKGFGASDSAALLEVSPFTTLMDLMHQKKYSVNDEAINRLATVRKGKELEDVLLSKITDRQPYKPNHMYGDDRTGLSVNFDGVSLENGILVPDEIKVCTFYGRKYYNFNKSILELDFERREKPTNDTPHNENNSKTIQDFIQEIAKHYGIPQYYFTQLQQQMYFLDAPHGYLNVMDDQNWCFHTFKIYRSDRVIEALCDIATAKYFELQVFRNELKEYYEDF